MNGLLLDAHVVLWAAMSPDRLSATARDRIADTSVRTFVSAVTIGELTLKSALGKLTLPVSAARMCAELGFEPLDLRWDHASRLAHLPDIHRDPFDRLLVAQAIVDGLTLVTADRMILGYPDVDLLPAS